MSEITPEQMGYAIGTVLCFVAVGSIYLWSKYGAEIEYYMKLKKQKKQAEADRKASKNAFKRIPARPADQRKASPAGEILKDE
ncbi:MAG: hypothetical protein AAB550_02995 [Patescibacteria group bacterium]